MGEFMKKNKAIAIFCLLFVFLTIFAIFTSISLNNNRKKKEIILAAVSSNVEGGGSSSGSHSTINCENISYQAAMNEANTFYNPSECITRDNLVGDRARVTTGNLAVVACIYNKNIRPTINCGNGGSPISYEGIDKNKTPVYIWVCQDSTSSNFDKGNYLICEQSYIYKDPNKTSSSDDKDTSKDTSNDIGGNNGPRQDYVNLCSNPGFKQASKIAGYVILIAKWLVPLIIIILGMVDFIKAILSSDENAINKATGSLIRRMITGIAVFITPGLIFALIDLLDFSDDIEESKNFIKCTNCLKYPYNDCQRPSSKK